MEDLYAVIRQFVIEAAELDDVDIGLSDPLGDYDVDSLVGLEVTVNLEKKYQVKIPPERYQEMTSIEAIGGIVKELLDAKVAGARVPA